MKKILLMMFLLTTLASMILAEDIQLQEITLDEFLTEYLPDYKIEKQIQLEGIGRDFAVAKGTGDIIALTKNGENFILYLFDNMGNLKWERNFPKIGYETTCSISDNGGYIVVRNYILERANNIVIDKYGNILFEKKLKDINLIPTPDGQYFYEEIGMMSNRKKGIHVYNRNGKKINISGFDFSTERNIRLFFLNDSQLISYMDTKFVFFDFKRGNFTKIWQYELDKEQWLDDFFQKGVKFTKKYIAISSISYGAKSYIFDYYGKLIYHDNFYQSLAFLNSKEILMGRRAVDNTVLRKLNINKLRYTDYNYLFKTNYFHKVLSIGEYCLFFINWKSQKDKNIVIANKMVFKPIYYLKQHIEIWKEKIITFNLSNLNSEINLLGGNYEN